MSNFIQQLHDTTLAVTISGVMSGADKAAFESAARAAIAKSGTIRVLIILKDFQGVGTSVDVNNLDFYADHADDIVKMAVVGDPKWKTEALVFTGAGARKTQVRFFETVQFGAAQQWLAAQ